MLVIKTDMTYTVTHHNDTCSPTRRDAKRSRREPQEGVRTASRSSDRRARSMSASAWRTPWTVAKPKTPAVAVRWRERRRSRPHPSRRRPDLTRKEQPNPKTPPPNSDNPTQPTQPNTKQPHSKHDSPVGPSACGSLEGSTARRGGGAPTAPLPLVPHPPAPLPLGVVQLIWNCAPLPCTAPVRN